MSRRIRDRGQIAVDRQGLRAEYKALFDQVATILFDLDPVGINFGSNTDEYEPEAGSILPRLRSCRSVSEARQIIYQEFVHWFDPETAGPESNYQESAEKIWAAWQRHQHE